MEETITVTFCDSCNPNHYFDVGHFFQAPASAALQAGWEERDYGIICPTCIRNEKYLEEITEDSGAIDGDHPIFELAAKVIKPETSVETTTGTLHDDGTFEERK